MAFPNVAATATSNNASGSTASVSLPSGVSSGDLLIIAVHTSLLVTHTTPSGWALLASGAASNRRTSVYSKTAAGGETSVSVTISSTSPSFHSSWRIDGHQGSGEAAAATGATDIGGDPPNLAPSGGTADYLWIAITNAHPDSGGSIDAAPADFSGLTTHPSEGTVGWATREFNGSSLNPGQFSADAEILRWVSVTVAVEGGGATPNEAVAAFTEPNESLTGAAGVEVSGSAAFTEANESVTGLGTVAVEAEAAFTEPNESLTSDADVKTLANAAFTEPNETLTGEASNPIAAVADFIEPNETLTGEASHPVSAVADFTEPDESLTSAVAVAIEAEADFTEPNETVGSNVDTGAGGFGRSNLRQINIGRIGIGV